MQFSEAIAKIPLDDKILLLDCNRHFSTTTWYNVRIISYYFVNRCYYFVYNFLLKIIAQNQSKVCFKFSLQNVIFCTYNCKHQNYNYCFLVTKSKFLIWVFSTSLSIVLVLSHLIAVFLLLFYFCSFQNEKLTIFESIIVLGKIFYLLFHFVIYRT